VRVLREREEEEARLARERRGVFAKAFAGASRVMGRLAASSRHQQPTPESPKVCHGHFSSPLCACALCACDLCVCVLCVCCGEKASSECSSRAWFVVLVDVILLCIVRDVRNCYCCRKVGLADISIGLDGTVEGPGSACNEVPTPHMLAVSCLSCILNHLVNTLGVSPVTAVVIVPQRCTAHNTL
jgi:hypothetical protein